VAVRVLIVDDSALVRSILTKGLSSFTDIEICGVAEDPYKARDIILQEKPDVVTLDIEMPKMNGIEFLRKLLPQYPIRVIMVSSLTENGQQVTFEALDFGAVDFVTKPSGLGGATLNHMINELHSKIIVASKVSLSTIMRSREGVSQKKYTISQRITASNNKVVAIGASTGGTEALKQVIPLFPASMPPVLVVQHIPKGFSKMFADRLNEISAVTVKEAQDGDEVRAGIVFVAPGEVQMTLKKNRNGKIIIAVGGEERYNGHCPSVGKLFKSVAREYGSNSVGVIMTGMGKDGAVELKEMRDSGARCIGQDEESSIVFGMPGEALKIGAVEKVVPLRDITESIINILKDIDRG
jgi:two-component system chemotaxis response regulator CheB